MKFFNPQEIEFRARKLATFSKPAPPPSRLVKEDYSPPKPKHKYTPPMFTKELIDKAIMTDKEERFVRCGCCPKCGSVLNDFYTNEDMLVRCCWKCGSTYIVGTSIYKPLTKLPPQGTCVWIRGAPSHDMLRYCGIGDGADEIAFREGRLFLTEEGALGMETFR